VIGRSVQYIKRLLLDNYKAENLGSSEFSYKVPGLVLESWNRKQRVTLGESDPPEKAPKLKAQPAVAFGGAFNIKFINYTANTIVPVIITAIVLFPLLVYIVFADEMLIPRSIRMHSVPRG
jgi:hypothetical protein